MLDLTSVPGPQPYGACGGAGGSARGSAAAGAADAGLSRPSALRTQRTGCVVVSRHVL